MAAHTKKEIAIRILFKLPAPVPLLWITGVSFCLLVASGVVVIVHSIPASYANVPDERAPSTHRAVAGVTAEAYSYSHDSQAKPAGARASINRQNRASCAECGVVDSVRQLERSGIAGRQATLDAKVAERVPAGAIASSTTAGKSQEITIRFRDGSTMVMSEAAPRAWPKGTRVIVIGRPSASND